MRVEVKIDPAYAEPQVLILTAAMTEEVSGLVRRLSEAGPRLITGSRDGKIEVLEPSALIRAYASAGKVYAVTEKGAYTLRMRLYELEERLPQDQFVRISGAEIVNLRKVSHFDLSLSGTICVKLSDGAVTYVSRRYVSKLKAILGIGGKEA